MEKERKQEQQVQKELQKKLDRLKQQKKILNEIINSKSPASVVPHQLNANNGWHKIIIKRNEVLKKTEGGKLEETYRKCLTIILESIREKLLSFLSMSPKENKRLEAVTEISDSKQKEQYKSYGLLLSSCHIKKSELATDKIECVLLQVAGRYHLTDDSRNKLGEYVHKAIRLTRTMLTLLPPTVIYLPLHYNEELHDTNRATWDEEEANKNPKLSISHYRPVLLYGNHLHVAVKGLIGKKLESSKRTPSPPPLVTKTQTLSTRAPPNPLPPPSPPPPPPAVPPPPPPITKTQTLNTKLPPPLPPPPPPLSNKHSIPHRHVNDYRQPHSSHSTTEPADKPKGQRRSRSPPLSEPLSPNKKSKDEERVENPSSLIYRSKEMAPSVHHSSATKQNEHKLQQNSKTRAAPSQFVPDTQYSSQGPPPLVAYLPASQGHSSTQMIEKRTDSMSSTPVQTAGASHQKQSTYSVSSSRSYHSSVSSRDIQDKMKREGDITSRVPTQTTTRRQGYEYRPDADKGVTPPTTSESAGIIQRQKETKTINNPAGATSKYNEPRPPAKQKKAKPPPSPRAVTKEKITGRNLKSGTATSSSHHLTPTTSRPSSSNKTSKASKGNGIHSQSPVPANKQASGYGRQITPQRTTPPQKSAVFKETVYPKTPTSSSNRLKIKSRPVSGNRNTKENANPPAAVTISRQRTTAGSRTSLDSNSRSKVYDRGTSYTPTANSMMTSQTSSVKTPMRALASVKDHLKSHITGPSPILPNMPRNPNRGPIRSLVHEYPNPKVGSYGGIPLPQGDRPQSRSNFGPRAKKYKESRPAIINATFKPESTIGKPTIKRPTKEQSPVAVSPKPCQTSPISSTQFIAQQEEHLKHKLRSGTTYNDPAVTVSRIKREQMKQKRREDVILCESRGGGAVQREQKIQRRK